MIYYIDYIDLLHNYCLQMLIDVYQMFTDVNENTYSTISMAKHLSIEYLIFKAEGNITRYFIISS